MIVLLEDVDMRTLVIGLLLSAAAWGQTDAAKVSPSGSLVNMASLRTAEVVPLIEPAVAIEAPVPMKATKQNKRGWMLLSAAAHSAAAFDAWTTRRSVSAGNVELNPLLKPFANSNSLYPVMQVGPAVSDFVGWKMMRSKRPLFRKLWWVPQVASAALSFGSGVKNTTSF
jgi:hypothetical protein